MTETSYQSLVMRTVARIRSVIDLVAASLSPRALIGRLPLYVFRPQLNHFIDWLNDVRPRLPQPSITFDEWQKAKTHPNDQNLTLEDFAIKTLADSNSHPVITIYPNTEALCSTIPKWPRNIEHLIIQLADRDGPPVRISDKWIRSVTMADRRPVILSRCRIETLNVNPAARLTLRECFVKTMKINGPTAFEDLHIEGGYLFRAQAPPFAGPGSNVFSGRVTIRQLRIPSRKNYLNRTGTDEERARRMYECRNIRNYLSAKNDLLAAGTFHAAELALERVDERWGSRWINWLYGLLSDYGNSVRRPLLWTLAGYGALAGIVLVFNSVVTPGMDSVKTAATTPGLIGWQSDLPDSLWLRALVYPFYAIFNPLNLFAQRPLMVSATGIWALVHSLVSLFGTLSVALFALAVRRRFKLD